jgi:hypothetical protein
MVVGSFEVTTHAVTSCFGTERANFSTWNVVFGTLVCVDVVWSVLLLFWGHRAMPRKIVCRVKKSPLEA